jgi:hypothetical protein
MDDHSLGRVYFDRLKNESGMTSPLEAEPDQDYNGLRTNRSALIVRWLSGFFGEIMTKHAHPPLL